MDVELVHEALAVLFDRFNTDVEDLGAFLVRTAFGDELEYLCFAGGQDSGLMGDATFPPVMRALALVVAAFGDGGTESIFRPHARGEWPPEGSGRQFV